MNIKTRTLNCIPERGEETTVVTRKGQSVTGILIRTFFGSQKGSVRGAIKTGPKNNDFATGFIGFYTEDC